jgi:aromatic ring-cleaving dioxygenase
MSNVGPLNHYLVYPFTMERSMTTDRAPYHAHIYYEPSSRAIAERLHQEFSSARMGDDPLGVLFVGELRDRSVGPHPKPQFEIHFFKGALPRILPLIKASGLKALVHPLTEDDLADHTSLASWIGEPLPLDQSVLDPPGANQGIARFGRSDF